MPAAPHPLTIPVADGCKGFVSNAFQNITPLGDINGDGVGDFGTSAPYDPTGIPPQDGYFVIFSGDTSFKTGVATSPNAPTDFQLQQSYPNPFNPRTTIEYSLLKRGIVSLKIFDVLGKEVISLINEMQERGVHHVQWDGRNSEGQSMASGIYYYQLQMNGTAETRKLVYLK